MPYLSGEDRNQVQMFPECLDDYITEDNQVRVIDTFVDSLDVKGMGFTKCNTQGPGAPSYNPKDIISKLLQILEKKTRNN